MTEPVKATSSRGKWSRGDALARIREAIRDFTEPRHISEAYTDDTGRTKHHVHMLPPLIDAVAAAIEPGADNGQADGGKAFESRPPIRLDPIRVLARINREARAWAKLMDLRRHTLRGFLLAINGSASQLEDQELKKLDSEVGSWWKDAKIVTGFDAPSLILDQPCPYCSRKALRITGTLDWAVCMRCQQRWDTDTIGLLGQMIQANTQHETLAAEPCGWDECVRKGWHDEHRDATGHTWRDTCELWPTEGE